MRLLFRTIHGLLLFALIGVFAYNTYIEIKDLNVLTQTIEVVSNPSIAPPALTLCAEVTGYDFNVTYYGEYVDKSLFLKTFQQEDPKLKSISNLVKTCWTLSTKDPSFFVMKDPPHPNKAAIQLNFQRDVSVQEWTGVYINIFDPFTVDTLFDYSRFVYLNADGNRAVQFTRTRSIDIHGNVTNDVQYSIVEEFRPPTYTQGDDAYSYIKFRAASFSIVVTRDVRKVTPLGLFRDSITLISALSTIYILVIGTGKFSPWGFAHRILRYYPNEHIRYKGTDVTREKDEALDPSTPQLEERLSVYLERFKRSKYENHP